MAETQETTAAPKTGKLLLPPGARVRIGGPFREGMSVEIVGPDQSQRGRTIVKVGSSPVSWPSEYVCENVENVS